MIRSLRDGLESTPLLAEVLPPVAPPPAAVAEANFESILPPEPDWLRELAAALATGHDLSALPPPAPGHWLPDVRRAETRPPRPSA